MKKIIALLLLTALLAGCSAVNKTDGVETDLTVEVKANAEFIGVVTKIDGSCMLVEPDPDSDAYRSSSVISIALSDITDGSAPSVGDLYLIEYNGDILETFPTGISNIIRCEAVEANLSYDAHDESNTEKELLPLAVFSDYIDKVQKAPEEKKISLTIGALSEQNQHRYNGDELQVFADFIKDELGIELDDRWQTLTHYYDVNKTTGMVQFQYFIGDIGTDKSIVFNLTDGISDIMYYSNIYAEADEQKLIDRVAEFYGRYEQEQYCPQEGEEITDSTGAIITYSYPVDTLTYCYNVFFTYGENKVINNDYGTWCVIGENGEAAQPYRRD